MTLISKEIISEINNRANIIDIIEEYTLLKQMGGQYKGLCPFHKEKTPSFSVNPNGMFYCFGCGAKGNGAISFVQQYLNLNFVEAVKILGDKYGIEIDANYNNLPISLEEQMRKVYEVATDYYHKILFREIGENALNYFRERNLSDETINRFDLGYSPDSWNKLYDELNNKGFGNELLLQIGIVREKNEKYYDFFRDRIIFPIRDYLGRTIAFGGRQLSEDKKQGKYINSTDSIIYDKKKVLFGLSESKNEIRKLNSAIVVEGYIDLLSLHQNGIKNVVASCGTALTKEQLETLKKYTNATVLYFMFDGDEAGQNASLKGIDIALELGFDLRIVKLSDGMDPDTLINKKGIAEINHYLENYFSFIDFMIAKAKSDDKFNTPSEKSVVLYEIMRCVLLIPDKVQHKFYIDDIQKSFGIDIESLRKIYANVKNKIRRKKNELNNYKQEFDLNNLNKPEYFLDNYNATNNDNDDYNYNEQSRQLQDLLSVEAIILQYSIQSSKYFETLRDMYEINENNFITDTAKLIFEIISEKYNNDEPINTLLNDDETDDRIKDIVANLSFKTIENSEHWSRFTNVSKETDLKALIDTPLNKLRATQIDFELKDLQMQLQWVNNDEKTSRILKRISDLNKEKQTFIYKWE